jgi:16S rRNA (uracil1498-N3)-methyltransferase
MAGSLQRLFVEAGLTAEAELPATAQQAHYLANVLRLRESDSVLLFNGKDGEWRAEIADLKRKSLSLRIKERTRTQSGPRDLHYLFAPLKRARLDYMAQKATEMGASVLQPAITRRTISERLNAERLHANAVEAAEQCNILWVPEIRPPRKLEALLDDWDPARTLIFADERAAQNSPIAALSEVPPGPLAVLIGPEGGFAPEERDMLLSQPGVVPISLGPRVMRADTAAVAALALINSTLGDWR